MNLSDGWRLLAEAPAVATRVRRAADVTDAVGPRSFLHAGPPLGQDDLVGPMRGAVLGALVLEGEAEDLRAAAKLLDSGEVSLAPCHSAGGVGAMAGIVSPSIPVVVVEGVDGRTAFAPLNEGLGEALRFGSTNERVMTRLRWMSDALAPVLDDALGILEGVDVVTMQAEGLRRGDECHNRNVASTAALLARLAPAVVRVAPDTATAVSVLEFLSGNPHTFLSFSMAAAKAIGDAAHAAGDTPGLVTAMCANGRRLGLRVSGVGGWVTAPAPTGQPKLFAGYTVEDACPAMGDSFITETVGIGAFALTAAPAISSFIGGRPEEAAELVGAMRRICRGRSERFLVPSDGFTGTPVGIDVELVHRTGIAPVVNNGFAHREPGVGQVGAGITQLPIAPFLEARDALVASSGSAR
ncbi:oxamate carbamoyltransferase subunit AllG family protein [Streptomyces sp. SYSU K21746]